MGYKIFRKIVRKMGYDLFRLPLEKLGRDPYLDMSKFVVNSAPVLFDVGANYGQTIEHFNKIFPGATIHSFEPSPNVFDFLLKKAGEMNNLRVWNYGVGAVSGSGMFNENKHQNMSSFLELGREGWGEIKYTTKTSITSIDDFCRDRKIPNMDILKIDTQGYELEVLKGASKMLSTGKIGLLYFEVNFIELYKNMPTFGQLYDFAVSQGYELITIYPIHYRNKKAGWSDVLFKHRDYGEF